MSGKGRYLFTSESVTEGHPDKIADQISDSILDAILAQDPVGRVACETLVTTGLAIVAGEITTSCYVDFPSIVRETIREVGYTRGKYGFDSETCAVLSSIHGQSPDIAQGVDPGGAGDQGLMFGYACTETPELMPMPIMLAHKLVRGLSERRRDSSMDYLRPDGKSQVSIEYDNGRPVRVDTIVVSTQHSPTVTNETLREDITEKIVNKVIPKEMMDGKTRDPHQPDRALRGRRAARRRRRDRPQDHRRHLWRRGAARRRRVLGERPDEGGSLGVLHGALRREERRRGRPRGEVHGAARLRHRRRRAGLGLHRDGGHGHDSRREDQRAGARALQADAARHHRIAGSAPSDLQEDGGLRTLRPHRARVHMGEDGQGGGASRATAVGSRRQQGNEGKRQRHDSQSKRLARRGSLVALVAAGVFLFVWSLPPRPRAFDAPGWDALAARTVSGAYHVHTTRSDGNGDRGAVAAAAARAGLTFVILTDHGDGTRPPDPPEYIDGVLVLDGVEISTDEGHYVAIDMPRAPYPLGGAADAVVEDVRRLGGFGIAAHPDSPKASLRWTDDRAPIDGLEWLNTDSEWRGESRLRLARAGLAYFLRPGPAMATLFDRPRTLSRWDRPHQGPRRSWRWPRRTRMEASAGAPRTRAGACRD